MTPEQQARLDALPEPLRQWAREDATVALYVGRHVRHGMPLGRALAQLQAAVRYDDATWMRHHDSVVRDTVPQPTQSGQPWTSTTTTLRTRVWCAAEWPEGRCRGYTGDVLRRLSAGHSTCVGVCDDCATRGWGYPVDGGGARPRRGLRVANDDGE